MDLLAVVMMLVLCRYCSAHCTPPAGSNLTSGGHGKLSNGIPWQNRGGPGSEFNNTYSLVLVFMVLN